VFLRLEIAKSSGPSGAQQQELCPDGRLRLLVHVGPTALRARAARAAQRRGLPEIEIPRSDRSSSCVCMSIDDCGEAVPSQEGAGSIVSQVGDDRDHPGGAAT